MEAKCKTQDEWCQYNKNLSDLTLGRSVKYSWFVENTNPTIQTVSPLGSLCWAKPDLRVITGKTGQLTDTESDSSAGNDDKI